MSLALPAKIVAPLLILMALGYFLKTIKLADQAMFRKMSRIGMRAFLSVNLFYNVYSSDFSKDFNSKLLLLCALVSLLVFVLACLIVPRFVKSGPDCGSLVQGVFRSNFVLFGVSVVSSAYGAESAGLPAMMSAFIVPLFNVFAVLEFEIFRGGKPSVPHILRGIVTNPLIVGSALGIAMNLLHIGIPGIIEDVVQDVAAMSSPFLIIALGGTFEFSGIKKYAKMLTAAMFMRLVAVPALGVGLAVAFGFRGVELMTALVLFGAPAATSSYAMALELGGNDELANKILVMTSVASIFTVFLWVTLLGSLGLI